MTTAEEYFYKGNDFFETQDWEEAIECFSRYIDLEPNAVDTYKDRAKCYIKLGQYDKAKQDLKTWIKSYKYEGAYKQLATMFLNMNKFDDSISVILTHCCLYGEVYYRCRALACVKLKEYDKAIDYFNKALNYPNMFGMEDSLTEIHCDISECYKLLGKDKESKEAYEKSILLYSEIIANTDNITIKNNAYLRRANCYKLHNEHKKAIEDLTIIIEKHESDIKFLEMEFDKPELQPNLYIDRADCYKEINEYNKAKQDYIIAKNEYQEEDYEIGEYNSYSSVASNYKGIANCYKELGEKEKSYNFYQKAIENYTKSIDDGFGDCYIDRAKCYEELGEYKLALEDYKRAFVFEFYSVEKIISIQRHLDDLEKNTSSSVDIFNDIEALMELIERPFDNYEDCEDEDSEIEEEDGFDDSQIDVNGIDCFVSTEQYKERIETYNNVIELHPKIASLYIQRGFLHLNQLRQQKLLPEVKHLMNQGILINSNKITESEELNDNELDEIYKKAVADFTKAIELEPDIISYKNRGECYALNENYDLAIEDYKKAIALSDDDIEIKELEIEILELNKKRKNVETNISAIHINPMQGRKLDF